MAFTSARRNHEVRSLRALGRAYGIQSSYRDGRGRQRTASADALIAVLRAMHVPIERPGQAAKLLRDRQREAAAGARRGVSSPIASDVPLRCYGADEPQRHTGVFLPLYALRSKRSAGVGDLGDLAVLTQWVRGCGCKYLGTLPLLAGFLDEPFEPSPYSPMTRLFWSELYLDLRATPKWPRCARARRIIELNRAALGRLRRADEIDYRKVMRIKRQAIDALAATAFADDRRRAAIEQLLRAEPSLDDFACFRAMLEQTHTTWQRWPARWSGGKLRRADVQPKLWQSHVYAQIVMREQLAALRQLASTHAAELYLDLPLGVNGGGYDTWRYRDQFAEGVSVGAPPDDLAAAGQNWGFPPLNPLASGANGHEYFALSLRNHMRYAGMLRLDHVMCLHRLFWIPDGMSATEGVYVRYPAEELYAVLKRESHRARCRVVGENLGTVPAEVNRALARHGLLGMRITQFELNASPRNAVPRPVAGKVGGVEGSVMTALNTHDMPPFASFWNERDIELLRSLDWIDASSAKQSSRLRASVRSAAVRFLRSKGLLKSGKLTTLAVLDAIHQWLAASDADIVLINLEDLWLEQRPQNVPGTSHEHANWRHRAARTLEQIVEDASLRRRVTRVCSARKRPASQRRTERV